MKAKTLLELMTLSTNLYMITKDEKLMNALSEMGAKGKEKFEDLMEEFEGNDEQKLSEKIMQKAHQAKEELENKIGEMVAKLYDKMNIAHTDQINNLTGEIESLKKELSHANERLSLLEINK